MTSLFTKNCFLHFAQQTSSAMERVRFVLSKSLLFTNFLHPKIGRDIFTRGCLLEKSKQNVISSYLARNFATTNAKNRGEDRRELIKSAPVRDQGADGEKSWDLDSNLSSRETMFPDVNTPNLLFDGVRFAELPICHIKASKNNTIMTLTDCRGKIKLSRSCGMEGFKHTKKGTNIAAQATGISLGKKCLDKGVINVRIKVQGLGPGRMTSVRGLQMSGMNIVSLSDDTPIPGKIHPRPRKRRKL